MSPRVVFLEKKGIEPNDFSDINDQNDPVIPQNTPFSKCEENPLNYATYHGKRFTDLLSLIASPSH